MKPQNHPMIEKPLWRLRFPGGASLLVRAKTRSEARAEAKKTLQTTRLPVGTLTERIREETQSA